MEKLNSFFTANNVHPSIYVGWIEKDARNFYGGNTQYSGNVHFKWTKLSDGIVDIIAVITHNSINKKEEIAVKSPSWGFENKLLYVYVGKEQEPPEKLSNISEDVTPIVDIDMCHVINSGIEKETLLEAKEIFLQMKERKLKAVNEECIQSLKYLYDK